jgi:toxin FitB
VNVVDSSAWLEYATNGPNAAFFASAIETTSDLMVPTIVIFEVYRHVLRNRGEDEALQVVGRMAQGAVIELNTDLALSAAQLAVDHKLAMADSIILATARQFDAALWTQDADFKDIAGVRYRAKA